MGAGGVDGEGRGGGGDGLAEGGGAEAGEGLGGVGGEGGGVFDDGRVGRGMKVRSIFISWSSAGGLPSG